MSAWNQCAVRLFAFAIKLLLLLPPIGEIVLVDYAIGRGGVHPEVTFHPGDADDRANVPTKSYNLFECIRVKHCNLVLGLLRLV